MFWSSEVVAVVVQIAAVINNSREGPHPIALYSKPVFVFGMPRWIGNIFLKRCKKVIFFFKVIWPWEHIGYLYVPRAIHTTPICSNMFWYVWKEPQCILLAMPQTACSCGHLEGSQAFPICHSLSFFLECPIKKQYIIARWESALREHIGTCFMWGSACPLPFLYLWAVGKDRSYETF